MTGPITVLHVFGRMERGGAELRTLDLMREVNRACFKLHFCALSGLPGELDEEIRRLGGEVHLMPLGPSFPVRFWRLLRVLNISAVHSHVLFFSGVIVWLAKLARVPVRIAHFRSTSDGYADSFMRRVKRRFYCVLIKRNATHILAVSRGAMQSTWGREWGEDPRCSVVYSGLPSDVYRGERDAAGVREELGFPSDALLVVHVGRMDPAKNHEHLIRVFAHLSTLEPRARLVLVGRGGTAIEWRIREETSRIGVADRVAFVGVRSDVPRLLRAADLMIFPSLWEGLPGAVLEACAAGIPVLASDVPGALEIAGYFDNVVTMPLAVPAAVWAERALGLLREGTRPTSEFESTPFSIASCARAMTRIWAS